MAKTINCKCQINKITISTSNSLWKKDGSLIGYNDNGDMISIRVMPDEINLRIITKKDIPAPASD